MATMVCTGVAEKGNAAEAIVFGEQFEHSRVIPDTYRLDPRGVVEMTDGWNTCPPGITDIMVEEHVRIGRTWQKHLWRTVFQADWGDWPVVLTALDPIQLVFHVNTNGGREYATVAQRARSQFSLSVQEQDRSAVSMQPSGEFPE